MSQTSLTERITQAISTLNESSGSSVPAIVKFVQSNSKGSAAGSIKTELKRMVDSKTLLRSKNSYKLSKQTKSALSKSAKPADSPTKLVAVAVAAKPIVKKQVKKASPKKAAKKSPSKKQVPKKTAKKTQEKPKPLANVPAPISPTKIPSVPAVPSPKSIAKVPVLVKVQPKAVVPGKVKKVAPKKAAKKASPKKASPKKASPKKVSAKKAPKAKKGIKAKAISRTK